MKSHKLIRIFISSTFRDFDKERKILNHTIFPTLAKECTEQGYILQFVDLRWGVPSTAEKTHDTMKICLRELRRSMEISPSSYLYIMLGDRYGWQPVPDSIDKADYDYLIKHMEHLIVGKTRAVDLFNRWYCQDKNSIDEAYVLIPQDMGSGDWSHDERLLRSAFDEVQDEISLSEKSIVKYYYSATGQEIAEGAILNFKNTEAALTPVSCYFRYIKDYDSYIDITETKHHKLQSIIERLKATFPSEESTLDFAKEEYNYSEYLKDFSAKTLASLRRMIGNKIEYDKKENKDTKENQLHLEFSQERVENFVGRENELAQISKFIKESSKSITIVHGERGAGKSAFHCKVATTEAAARVVVARYVGVTASSNDLFLLLCDLCETIWNEYSKAKYESPTNYPSAIVKFKEVLEFATQEKPLLVIIDALDQLPYTDNFKWLPEEIQSNVKFILGTRSEENYYDTLKNNIHKNLLAEPIEIKKLSQSDSEQVLSNWLNKSERKKVALLEQKKIIFDAISGESLPIYLKILFEKIKSWRSFDCNKESLDKDVQSMIKSYFFDEMSEFKGHSKVMTDRALAYISLGKNGVSELEILELLSVDEKVMDDLRKKSYNGIEVNTSIPFMIWARFYGDIEPYMKHIFFLDDLNITFYHEQIRETTDNCIAAFKEEIKEKLIQYYDKNKRTGNKRALSSLPFHIMTLEKDSGARMSALLQDTEYIAAKIDTDMLPDLVSEYEWLVNHTTKEQASDAIKTLFVTFATLANNRADKKKLWDDIHSNMIFRFDRTLHDIFFTFGVEQAEALLPNFNAEELLYVKVSCLISKQNYYRRMGRISKALEIGKTLLGSITIPEEFKSMVYYDNGYINFLAGCSDSEVLDSMQESYNYSKIGDPRGYFSKIVGNFLSTRINLFNENKYAESLKIFFDYVTEVLGSFARQDADKFGKNKLSNILEYLGLISYYNNDEKGAREALCLFEGLEVVKSSTDKTRQRLAKAMLLALQKNYTEACREMQELIAYKLKQVAQENRETEPQRLVESIAQMYYLLNSWHSPSEENMLDTVRPNGEINDNGNGIWCNADLNYEFKENPEITERVESLLKEITRLQK